MLAAVTVLPGERNHHVGYQYNPLEVWDHKSAVHVARIISEVNQKTMVTKAGTWYCAEGQNGTSNLGPKGEILYKKSNNNYAGSRAVELIEAFGQAPGYQGKSPEYCEHHPEIGWQHLRDSGKITQTELMLPLRKPRGGARSGAGATDSCPTSLSWMNSGGTRETDHLYSLYARRSVLSA